MTQNDPFCLMSLLGLGPNMTQNDPKSTHFGSFLAIFGDPQISPFWPKPHGSSLLLGLPGQKGSKSGQVLGPPGRALLSNRRVPRRSNMAIFGSFWVIFEGFPLLLGLNLRGPQPYGPWPGGSFWVILAIFGTPYFREGPYLG